MSRRRKETYWERKRFEDFAYEDLPEYKAMTLNSAKCNMFAHMYQIMDVFKGDGDESFLEYLEAFSVSSDFKLRKENFYGRDSSFVGEKNCTYLVGTQRLCPDG